MHEPTERCKFDAPIGGNDVRLTSPPYCADGAVPTHYARIGQQEASFDGVGQCAAVEPLHAAGPFLSLFSLFVAAGSSHSIGSAGESSPRLLPVPTFILYIMHMRYHAGDPKPCLQQTVLHVLLLLWTCTVLKGGV